MTEYIRITPKLFGGSASSSGTDPEIAQFGSGLAGTYTGTTDVNTIQSLPAWQNGFIDCVTPSEQFPPLPEMTGFGKVLSYLICYNMQHGVPEWDSGTTYYSGCWCSSNGNLYVSLQDENLNNAVTNSVYWEKFTGGTFVRNFGELVMSSLPQTDSTLHLADGSLLSYSNYPSFIDYIDSIYTGDTGVFTSEANWQSSYSSYGECGKYVYNSATKQVRLPLYASSLKFSSNLSNLGVLTPAGLPAHTHTATTASAGTHTHDENSAGSHKHTINNAGYHTHTIVSAGIHTHTIDSAGTHTHTESSAGSHNHTRGTMNITGVGVPWRKQTTTDSQIQGAFYISSANGFGLATGDNDNRMINLDASRSWTGESSSAGSHTHTIADAGAHTHTAQNSGDHSHTMSYAGEHYHSEFSAGSHTHTIADAGAHTHTITVASGGAIGTSATLQPQSITQLVYIVVAK